jgi:hypothetical protein
MPTVAQNERDFIAPLSVPQCSVIGSAPLVEFWHTGARFFREAEKRILSSAKPKSKFLSMTKPKKASS